MSLSNIKERVRLFVNQSLQIEALGDNQDLFAGGFVNSLFGMQLVTFIEKEFGVAVSDEDLDFGNFCSIDAIDGFVRRKLAARSDAAKVGAGTN